jgi:O-antigen/teichoic acid export membrane protein
VIVVFGEALLKIWLKTDIGIQPHTLWVMALWIVALSVVRVQILLLNALGILKFQIWAFSIATALGFVLKFILAPRYGVAGILLATAVTFPVIILPAVLWRISRWRRDLRNA